jgi:hypothetical protein
MDLKVVLKLTGSRNLISSGLGEGQGLVGGSFGKKDALHSCLGAGQKAGWVAGFAGTEPWAEGSFSSNCSNVPLFSLSIPHFAKAGECIPL